MQLFITGTDTGVGKTTLSAWICLHTGYDYIKPIQTGPMIESDTNTLHQLTTSIIHSCSYHYEEPCSPHLAAYKENSTIDLSQIKIPAVHNLIIEGAGGVFVPLNKGFLMIDLIALTKAPILIVASARLGTINHTLLTIQALRERNLPILGVILNGDDTLENKEAIEYYGTITVIATFPTLSSITQEVLKNIPLPSRLKELL